MRETNSQKGVTCVGRRIEGHHGVPREPEGEVCMGGDSGDSEITWLSVPSLDKVENCHGNQ